MDIFNHYRSENFRNKVLFSHLLQKIEEKSFPKSSLKKLRSKLGEVFVCFWRKWEQCKDWPLKKETKVYSRFLIEKTSEFLLLLYQHFLWLWELWNHQRILKKIAILKIWWLGFFWGVKTCFSILLLYWCIFRHEKRYLNHW